MQAFKFTIAITLVLAFLVSLAPAQDKEQVAVPEKAAKLLEQLGQQTEKTDNASDNVKAFIKTKLQELCTNPTLVKAVKAQNAKKTPLDQIKKVDQQWQEAEDELPIQAELMGNSCAKEIEKIMKQWGVITECFVMDNQGANVGQNTLTSDYWQGDEAKWKESYNDGKGGLHVDKAKLDKSTNQVDQKFGLPIIDEDGNVVGAICIGLDVERVPTAK